MPNIQGVIGGHDDFVTSDQRFGLGDFATGSDGTAWVYVQAGEAISQYDFVAIDEDFQALKLGLAEINDGHQIGVAQVAFTNDDFGWVAIRGANLQGNVGDDCAADVELYAGATDGTLDDSSAGTSVAVKVDGIVAVDTQGGTSVASNVEVLLTYPKSTDL